MIHVAVRVRELVSSNIDAIVTKAADPAKALGLLRAEVEETLITLTSELSMTRRQHARTVSHAEKIAAEAEAWSAKAQVAVDHGREDLARAALQARQKGLENAAAVKDEAARLGKQVAELEGAIGELEVKRAEVLAQIARPRPAENPSAKHRADSKSDRHMERIDELERRLAFQSDRSANSGGSEIETVSNESLIDAELEAMKAARKSRDS